MQNTQNNINGQYYKNNINGHSQNNQQQNNQQQQQNKFKSLYDRFFVRYLNSGNMNQSQIQQKVNLFCKQNNCSQQMYKRLHQKVTQEYSNHNNDVNFLTPTSPQTRQRKPGQLGKSGQQYKKNNDVNSFFNGYTDIPTPKTGDRQTQNGGIPTPKKEDITIMNSYKPSVQQFNNQIQNTLLNNYIPNNDDIQQYGF